MLKTTLVWIGLGIIAVVFSGCGPRETESPSQSASPSADSVKDCAWPGVPYKTVTAYEFARRHGAAVLVVQRGASDLSETMKLLGRYKIAEKEISEEMARGIINAATCGIPRTPGHFRSFMCYIPHHMLVYRDVHGRPVAAMEICITCEKWLASSNLEIIERGEMDVAKLKATFGELGLLHPNDYGKVQPDEDMEPVSSGSPFPPSPADSK